MKRDMELVRDILKGLEESEHFEVPLAEVIGALPDFDSREIVWHLGLMEQAGLITTQGFVVSDHDGKDEIIESVRISWSGYEFLAAAMNETVWNTAKRRAGGMFNSLSLGTLQALLESVVRQAVL